MWHDLFFTDGFFFVNLRPENSRAGVKILDFEDCHWKLVFWGLIWSNSTKNIVIGRKTKKSFFWPNRLHPISEEMVFNFKNFGDIKKARISAFSDTSHANLKGGSSQGGYIIFLHGKNNHVALISYRSRKINSSPQHFGCWNTSSFWSSWTRLLYQSYSNWATYKCHNW